MSERFKELPEEKQLSILRAATEVFSKYEYKKASTDLIAAKAGVSKGLLFYYFHNKKDLYLTVFEYVKRSTTESVTDPKLLEMTDFFELIAYASVKKFKMMAENPYMVEFAMRSFYSDKEEISDDLKGNIKKEFEQSYIKYFSKIDLSKFREDVNPFEIYKMMIWLVDGYLHELQMNNEPLCLDAIETALSNWTDMFKRIAYKEEYL
ncbi:MAG: TetR/AcrR family transcriptional regulator [Lachnospiraceae bacterium]|nr:TetR/AcrR family transcriptional regulator [Lachnospiraceae bacterium]